MKTGKKKEPAKHDVVSKQGDVAREGSLFARSSTWLVSALFGLLVLTASPFAWTRMIGYAVLLVAGTVWLSQSANRIRSALVAFFLISFVLSPYWRIEDLNKPFPPWIVFVALSLFALFWACYNRPRTDFLPLPFPTRAEVLGWAFLLFVWIILQSKAVFVEIPWRGDEYHHINVGNLLISSISSSLHSSFASGRFFISWPGLVLIATLLLRVAYAAFEKKFLATRQKKWWIDFIDFICRYGWILGIATALCAAGVGVFPEWQATIRRYPFVREWLSILSAMDKQPVLLDEPWWLRVGSMAFTYAFVALIFSFCFRATRDWLVSIAAALAGLTLPLTARYGVMFYIEPYFLPFLAIVMFYPRFLTARTGAEVRGAQQNTALSLFLLIKETSVAALGAVALLRFWTLIRQGRILSREFVLRGMKEALYLLVLAAGLILFLHYQRGATSHPFKPAWAQLVAAGTYARFLKSLWDNMGILPLFAFAGVLWSVRKRLWSQAFVPLAFFSAYFCLLALDDLQTLGYARQNLHILPVTIALALPVLVSLTKSKRILTLGLLAAAIVTNVFLYPFDLKTGIPKPYWGCHNVRWFETHFPIKETVDWLLANKKGRPTIAYMHDYGHAGLMWALERAGMKDVQQVTLDELCPAMAQLGAIKPEETQRFWMYLYVNVFAKEEEGLAAALYAARRQNTELVIYLCVSGTQPPSLPEGRMADYKLAALFKTPFRAIAIFELPEAVLKRTRPPLGPSILSPRE